MFGFYIRDCPFKTQLTQKDPCLAGRKRNGQDVKFLGAFNQCRASVTRWITLVVYNKLFSLFCLQFPWPGGITNVDFCEYSDNTF